jgi:hypothetical protein
MKRWAVAIAGVASLGVVAGLYALPASASRSTPGPGAVTPSVMAWL